MSQDVIAQSQFWLWCLATGVLITFLYDLFRIFRQVCPHGKYAVSIEDVIFWVLSGIIVFRLMYKLNDGTLRWFTIFGLLCGMYLYKKIIGDHIVNFMSTVITRTLHLVEGILIPPLKLVKRVFLRCFYEIRKWLGYIKKQLTSNIKKVTMVLCKRKRGVDNKEIGSNHCEP